MFCIKENACNNDLDIVILIINAKASLFVCPSQNGCTIYAFMTCRMALVQKIHTQWRRVSLLVVIFEPLKSEGHSIFQRDLALQLAYI